ncbi:hypothetical protein [Pradoshia sp.]
MGESPINREIKVNLDVLRKNGEWEYGVGKTPIKRAAFYIKSSIKLANRLAAVKVSLTAERSQSSGKV